MQGGEAGLLSRRILALTTIETCLSSRKRANEKDERESEVASIKYTLRRSIR